MSTLTMDDKNLILMNSILMDGIAQLEEWRDAQMNDPRFTAAVNRFDTALEQARTTIPEELYRELDDAYADGISAIGDIGILFGIHVADAIRDVTSRPADLSRYILERMESGGVTE